MTLIRTWRMMYPDYGQINPAASTLIATLIIDATGEKAAYIGRVYSHDRTTKAIRKVGFRLSTVVKAGGSALTVSLQDVDLTTGSPFRPDGTMDQSVAVPNASIPSSNNFLLTGNLSSDRTVAHGALVAVVVEFDGSGRLGSDALTFTSINLGTVDAMAGCALFSGAAWAIPSTALPNVVFEFSDGTYGALSPGFPVTFLNSAAITSSSSPDEVGNQFTMPFACECDGCTFQVQAAASAAGDFDVILYDSGGSTLASVTVDSNAIRALSSNNTVTVTWPPINLYRNATYYIMIKPLTGNGITPISFQAANAGHLQAFPGGTRWKRAHRTDAGAWTVVDTEVFQVQLSISGIEIAVGTPGVAAFNRYQLGM